MSIIKRVGGSPNEPPHDQNIRKTVIKKEDANVEQVKFATIPATEEEAKKAKEKLETITQKVQTPESLSTKEGNKIIEAAKVKVAQMFANAKEEVRRMVEAGRLVVQSKMMEAQQEGFKQGKEEGIAAGRQELAGLVENLKDAFGQLMIEKEAFLEKGKEEISKLTLACLKEILGEEIKTNPEVIFEVAKKAIELAKSSSGSDVVIFVNPQDKERVEAKKEIFAGIVDLEQLKIKSDHSVTPGGCKVTTNLGSVDATIETQLKALEIAFEEVSRSYDVGEPDQSMG